MILRRLVILGLLFLFDSEPTLATIQEIVLRADLPAGEEWFTPEKGNAHVRDPNEKWVRRVKRPVLEVYETAKPNGSAVIIAPGGSFEFLAIEHEGRKVADWFNARGFTAFVLRYRCGLELDKNQKLNMQRNASNSIEDGLLAVRTVRERAKQFKIDPKRISILGFSAGGYAALGVATMFSPESRPDYAMAIYPVAPIIIRPPKDLPPLFVAASFDDKIDEVLTSVTSLIPVWKKANVSMETHVFSSGQHGFGMNKQNTASDDWTELLAKWMHRQGIMAKSSEIDTYRK